MCEGSTIEQDRGNEIRISRKSERSEEPGFSFLENIRALAQPERHHIDTLTRAMEAGTSVESILIVGYLFRLLCVLFVAFLSFFIMMMLFWFQNSKEIHAERGASLLQTLEKRQRKTRLRL